jgi:outer membrane protein OmpA-like peptidoglycan-associated protein
MAKCRPSKWIPWAPLVALPLLASYLTTTGGLVDDVKARATQALAGDLTSWAKVESDGRDVTLQGTAPSQEAVDAAVKAVAGTYGVRTLVENKAQIVEPVKLAAPTVESYLGNADLPTIKGTWPEKEAVAVGHNLQVALGSTTYELGKTPELTSDGSGNWQLFPSAKLTEGAFDVLPSLIGPAGAAIAGTAAAAKVVIDMTAPTVAEVTAGDAKAPWPHPIFGKWAETDGNTLSTSLNNVTYDLGKAPELTSDGSGNFTFDPKFALPPGSYDLGVYVKDKAGNIATQILPAAVVIPEPEAPKVEEPKKVETPPPPPAPEVPNPAKVEASADGMSVSGSWDAKPANTLTATFAGKTVVLDQDASFNTGKIGTFVFKPDTKDLAPGAYDVKITTSDDNEKTGDVTVLAQRAIIVPMPPPPPESPNPAKVEAAADGKVVTGSWDNKPGNVLSATFKGKTVALDQDPSFTAPEPGKFAFAPATAGLAPGKYDVRITTSDAIESTGDITVLAQRAIVVPEPPAPPPPPPAESPNPAKVEASADGVSVAGSWDAKPSNTLSATFEGKTFALGTDAALATPETGKFVFTPDTTGLAPGKYDVRITTSDDNEKTGDVTVLAQRAIIVPEPAAPPPPPKVEIPAPVVFMKLDLTGAPVIKGKWPNTVAQNLAVTVNDRTYTLGKDANLSVKDEFWSVLPGSSIADGKYDVTVVASDAAGNSSTDTTSGELTVVATQPAAPTVMTYAKEAAPDHLSGTWDASMAKGLVVTVPSVNLTAELGKDPALTTDATGNWRLDLSGTTLPAGTYAVTAQSRDKYGRLQDDATDGEVIVLAKNEPPPPPPPPYDCVATMNRISAIFPIRFEYDLTIITKPFDLSVNQYAALLKDPRCASLNVTLAGNADFMGSEKYNIGLSERRAVLVRDMLKEAGVDPSRMTVEFYGETRPLDNATTDEARAKNRRVDVSPKQ